MRKAAALSALCWACACGAPSRPSVIATSVVGGSATSGGAGGDDSSNGKAGGRTNSGGEAGNDPIHAGGASGSNADDGGAAGAPPNPTPFAISCEQDPTYLHRVRCEATFAGVSPDACRWYVNDSLVPGATGCSEQIIEGLGSGTYELETNGASTTVQVSAEFEQPVIVGCSVQSDLETWLHGTCTRSADTVQGHGTLYRIAESDLTTPSGTVFTWRWEQDAGTFSSNERLEAPDDFTLVVELCEDVDGSDTLDAAETNCGSRRVTGAIE